jgi:hypothetical protein
MTGFNNGTFLEGEGRGGAGRGLGTDELNFLQFPELNPLHITRN